MRKLLLVVAVGAALAAIAANVRAAGGVLADADEEGSSLLDEILAGGAGLLEGERMNISSAGLELLKRLEGLSPTWYADADGHSIGYGHFGLETLAFPGEAVPSLPENLATQLLAQDVAVAERAVSSAVRRALTQAQFDALVCFTYNVGAGALRSSTLVRKLNAGDYTGAAAEFARWRFARDAAGNKVENPGLAKRRQREAQLFAMNDYGSLA